MSQTKAQLVGGVGISTVSDLSVYGGVNATGVITATSFSGNGSGITGVSSVSFATTSYVLAGTPNLTVGFITATGASISGNVDSVGIVTARSGIRIGNVSIASTLGSDGGAVFSGIVTATSFVGSGASLTNLPASGVSLPKIYFINN